MSKDAPPSLDLTGHVAVVTGANHGIGAATARMLAACGANVLLSYLRSEDLEDAGTPDAYGQHRAASADEVVSAIEASGGTGLAVEADLTDPEVAVNLFDAAERSLGPVDILVNNASGWVADTFKPEESDRLGRSFVAALGLQFRSGLWRRRARSGAPHRRVRQAPHQPRRDVGADRWPHIRRLRWFPR